MRVAKVLGAKSPYLYRTHGDGKEKRLERGMNFAFGGSKVFDSPVDQSPNMSTQVDLLVNLFIARSAYTFNDISSSDVAVLTYSGKDYHNHITKNGMRVRKTFSFFLNNAN